jgi:acyl-CoA synthetase (AMP-forming)/AMP-acid ligase II
VNTASLLAIPAGIVPDQTALVFGDRRQTYAATLARVRRLAGALAALGVAKGDRVALLDTNSPAALEAYFATSMLGGVFVPLNYRAKLDELEYLVRTAGVRLLLVGTRYMPLATALRQRFGGIGHCVAIDAPGPAMRWLEELIAEAPSLADEVEVEDDDTSILMYTSGTTGRPKGVLLTHGDFVGYVCGHTELADGTPRGAALLCVPLYHIAGITVMLTSVFAGRTLVLLPQFEPTAWLETVQRERITHAFLVPTMLKRLLDHPDFARYDCSSLQVLGYGAAPMPLPVIRRAIEMFPKTVGFVNAFGQTETTATVTMLLPDDHRLEGPPAEVERKLRRLASIGRPLPDVEVKIVDASGAEVPRGTVGEIVVRTPRLMKGYVSSGEAVAAPIVDGWLHTRDLGWMDEDGYLYLAGRQDDLIIRGGENISPAEVEAVLHAHPEIAEAAVIGVPDVEWGERVMAIVVRRPGSDLTAAAVMEWCRQRLASFKKPEEVRFVDELPRNALGKVLRQELRAMVAGTAG